MDSSDQAGMDERRDLAALNQDAQTFMAEKGMIFNTPPDTSSFRKKFKDVGFYAEWKGKLEPEVWNALHEISGPMT
jgi:TRAP-type C4-dicarboxylate transport system substrate-binding protein